MALANSKILFSVTDRSKNTTGKQKQRDIKDVNIPEFHISMYSTYLFTNICNIYYLSIFNKLFTQQRMYFIIEKIWNIFNCFFFY
jgi:hypothetical protein